MSRRTHLPEAGWIEFPPRWPERDGAQDETERERPPVLLTSPIPRLGRRERPKVLRIVTGGAPGAGRRWPV